ncbi:ferric reductase NAD binding domain-containing protein [Phlebopus sp. FC_14]|nr:ferric reductase NAD binding domain-containing protein [Phlebopus sp. FC_14]
MDSVLSARAVRNDKTVGIARNILYTKQAWYCIGLFIFIIGIFQWTLYLHAKLTPRRPPSVQDKELASAPRTRAFSLRRLPAALTNAYRVIAFRWTLDIGKTYTLNMAEVFVTLAYIIFVYVWTFINTTDLEGHKLSMVYWCNRAGGIAVCQFPLITVLGTKNNFVSLVTGISYDKLNYVHRMMARVVFTLLWVHASGEIISFPSFQDYLQDAWLRCAILAVAALTVLMFASLRPIRAGAYEFFFYTHFAMVLVFLIGAYYHTSYIGAEHWIYPCFVIWAFDRLVRFIRLVLFNHSYFGFSSGSTMDATVELLSDDFVRLHFLRPSHFHWTPGQTAYLIMPFVSRIPFEAHPFTIASFDSNLFESIEAEKTETEKSNKTKQATDALGASVPFWKEVVFFINVREGFTARLKEAALKGKKVKVFVDGPYGPSPDLGSYDTSVLIAGGSGVSYTLPTLLDVIEQARDGRSNCRRVVFIWSIRDANHVRWIDETLLKALQLAPSWLSISIRIHVTGPNDCIDPIPRLNATEDSQSTEEGKSSEEPESPQTTEKSGHPLLALESVKLEKGRPNLPAMLKEEVDCTTGSMSVSVCGSLPIARTVREALCFPVSSPSNVLNGGPSVTLHVESFGYA